MEMCQRGHEFTAENTYVRPDGRRRCRRCQNDRMAKARAAKERPAATPQPPRLCSIEGCDRLHNARGWCATHYRRWTKTGSTDAPIAPTPAPCGVADCDRPQRRNGYCGKHSQRLDRHGDPEAVQVIEDPAERFASKVDHDGPVPAARPDLGACWIWTGVHNSRGYGRFAVGKKYVQAHRWSYEHHVGPIPVGLEIDHQCFVTSCVRPEHLEPVTRGENERRKRARVKL